MKKILKNSDILFVFDELKNNIKKAEANLIILPALINRFLYLLLQDITKISQAKVFLNHLNTSMDYKFESFDKPLTIVLYLNFDYVPASKRIELEKLIKEQLNEFKFKSSELKFIKEEGIYIKFTKEIL